jgi:predicted phosphodiesterase
MRIALISDIHSNLEALTAVLARIKRIGCDEIWCLGDIVGYGADPHACIALVRENCSLVITGNHDTSAGRGSVQNNYTHLAKEAILWTIQQLKSDEVSWLQSLPVNAIRQGYLLCHGALHQRDAYIDSAREAARNLELMRVQYPQASTLLCGHTHVKALFSQEHGWMTCPTGCRVDWPVDALWLVNPGSVGQARDHCPKASWALLDVEKRRLDLMTTSYEIGTAQKKILAAGLPPWLAERLESAT